MNYFLYMLIPWICFWFIFPLSITLAQSSSSSPPSKIGRDDENDNVTTYLAHHYLSAQKEAGWEFRKNLLISYAGYQPGVNHISLRERLHHPNNTSTQQVVGHTQKAMFFHMLKQLVGEKVFLSSIRKLAEQDPSGNATWPEIRQIFESETDKDLKAFFNQWLDRRDIIHLQVVDARSLYKDGRPIVSLQLKQVLGHGQEPFRFDLKVAIITSDGNHYYHCPISRRRHQFEFPLRTSPTSVIIDPDYDLLRTLYPDETPPVLSHLLGDTHPTMIVNQSEQSQYTHLIESLQDDGFTLKFAETIKETDWKNASLFLLGCDNAILPRLFGMNPANALEPAPKHLTIQVKKHPLNTSKVVVSLCGNALEAIESLITRLPQYQRYSTLDFEPNGNLDQAAISPVERGIRLPLMHRITGIDTRQGKSVEEILDHIQDKPIIYLGESHSSYEDHRAQLEVIRQLYARGEKIAIGMEMFQQQFQKVIDNYLMGSIDERAFLKQTEYYQRWRFDYRLYREVINFAKAKRIPIVALNIDGEITHKVAQDGLDALSKDELQIIPKDMNLANETYQTRLQGIFKHHPHSAINNRLFNNFYQAQIIWDETMAHRIAWYLNQNPDTQMVILAGSGHIRYGTGIPKRAGRLTGKAYSILLISGNLTDLDSALADYVLFTEPINLPPSPRFGITIAQSPDGVEIKAITPGGSVGQTNLDTGDILLEVDGLKIETPEDVEIAMLDRKIGDKVKIKVLSKRFLLENQIKELWVDLQ